MSYIWKHNRRYNAYSNYFKQLFGERIQKLSIDAGFTCPNRDGVISKGGCTFCNNDAFNPSYCQPEKTITQQINEGIEFHSWRYRHASQYLAYFQAYSNTYAPLEKLQQVYNEALAHPSIIGLIIGTRPDCIDDEKLAYFAELAKTHYIAIEYGIESCYDKTLKIINRGHDFETTVQAIQKTAQYGIKTGGHIIFGLPGETIPEMLAEADTLSRLPLTTLKFHQLQIIKGTWMEQDYILSPDKYTFFQLEAYIDFVIDFLEQLNPNIVIERFVSEVPPRFQAGEHWGLIRNEQILNKIEKRLLERDTYQGKYYLNQNQ